MPVPYAFRSLSIFVDENVAEQKGAARGELLKKANKIARLWQGRRSGVSVAEDRAFGGSAATAVALR